MSSKSDSQEANPDAPEEKLAEQASEKKATKKAAPKAASPKKEASAKSAKPKPAAKASTKATTKATPSAPSNRTVFINPQTAERKWVLIDAKGQNLGRLCVEVAKILRGKRKASFTPNNDAGDFVVVINAAEVVYTGKKKGEQTIYYRYTGYPGGLRKESLEHLLQRSPEKVIMKTVKGMLPKNTTVGDKQLTKLKVYAGSKHPHAAQNPKVLESIPKV
jgi:large subunit ribosomal protein L13